MLSSRTTQLKRRCFYLAAWATVLVLFFNWPAQAAAEVYLRFQLLEPPSGTYFVRLGGYIHKAPWYLPPAVWPSGADKNQTNRIAAGEFTPWLNFSKFAGDRLHGQQDRAGGVAEFPNVTADFIVAPASERRRVVIEIATAPDKEAVVKRFEESYRGSLTSFLVSSDAQRDADSLETASQMTERRLRWAKEASSSQRVSPSNIIIETSFWNPQRPELNLKEAEVLWLLGFNVLGNQMPEVREKFGFRVPGHTHNVLFGPSATAQQIDGLMKGQSGQTFAPGVPFGFSDEVVCRPPIGNDAKALEHFHQWLTERRMRPRDLGVKELKDVVPLETPEAFHEAEKKDGPAARRIFYATSRFRQESATQRIKWHTEAFHRYAAPGPLTSTLVADHPYFSGTGLGMGMVPNTAWGGAPLALDWFDLARNRVVDLIGIEDWMGLQYMYGPDFTWEGFQLMGFQAAIFRSGSRGEIPIIAWITPSDETNLRLKSFSALCQGAKHFFYWTYGPTPTSTENYWSDLRGMYDGIANVTRRLAAAEQIIVPGRTRNTKVALLYSLSSDLWQPFGYVHMLERRATYLALVHDQFLVDMLSEQDIEAGRLEDYKVLYATDPCITEKAALTIKKWVKAGGYLYGSCATGSRNEFNEPCPGLSEVFGVKPELETETQEREYRIRGGLNPIPYAEQLAIDAHELLGSNASFGVIGTTVKIQPTSATAIGKFQGGTPAVVINSFGRGKALYAAACPGLSYLKDARFVARELKESYPAVQRRFINAWAEAAGAPRLVQLSHPVVEAGVYDAPKGTALVLANFTYQPIPELAVSLPLPQRPAKVRSLTREACKFTVENVLEKSHHSGYACVVNFKLPLDLNDIVLVEWEQNR